MSGNNGGARAQRGHLPRAPESEHHQRGANVANGLPSRKRTTVRVAGNDAKGWPAHSLAPRPPAIMNLVEVLDDPEDQPAPVFGQYPKGLITKLLPLMRCDRREILHVCSGALRKGEGIRVDRRPEARPDILADGRALPLRDGSIAGVMLDPPYTEGYARDLYGIDYPRPSHLLAEAARVVRPCGRIAFVHFIVPNPPPRCRIVKVLGLTTGCGFQMRAVTIFEREQDSLAGVA